ncbi:MAG: SDR family NAD(P)-dependent oxidoreductase [Alphaproteobacteria bacterium]|nr:SDR family NAD(P)-dependent oxidoreductase [Alphaproteobacteria bacterium]
MTDAPGPQVAWVTGAGKGIGRAVARRLALNGWTVAASARTAEDLASLAADCPPGAVHGFPLDVTDLAMSQSTVQLIERQLGEIELAVLNAGTHSPMAAEQFSVETFRRLVETNLMGTVNGLAQIIPKLIERKRGHIAVVASLAGYRGLPTAAAYGATKAGLINMCEALKPELECHGVRLTLINPGFIETPLTDKNDFPMPYLMPVEDAADRIVRGLRRTAFEVAFPWRFAFLMKFLRLLPDRMFFMLTRRMIGG